MSALWVALAGGLGAGARFVLDGLLTEHSNRSLPTSTLIINVAGSFLLGVLLEVLALVAPEGNRRRGLQLTFGTGLLGGYTTYSTFVVETVNLGRHGSVPLAAIYAAGSVLAGFTAALLAMSVTRAAVRATWTDTP